MINYNTIIIDSVVKSLKSAPSRKIREETRVNYLMDKAKHEVDKCGNLLNMQVKGG